MTNEAITALFAFLEASKYTIVGKKEEEHMRLGENYRTGEKAFVHDSATSCHVNFKHPTVDCLANFIERNGEDEIILCKSYFSYVFKK